MDRGAWHATVHSVAESDTTERLTLSLEIPIRYAGVIPSPEFRGKGRSGQRVKGTERGGTDDPVWGVDGDREEAGRLSWGIPVLRAQG